MLIKSLEEMQTIVENNKTLAWDGWNVIQLKASPLADMQINAKFINGKWYETTNIELSEKGWDVPNKLVQKNVQR
jgi:hypothetical protein